MVRAVTIISLLFSVTVSAAPSRKGPPKKCEDLATNSGPAAEIAALAGEVRETIASINLRQTQKDAPGSVLRFAAKDADIQRYTTLLSEMSALAASIESALGNAPGVAERDMNQLRKLMEIHMSKIQTGIALVQFDPVPFPRTQNVMKREILKIDPMAEW